MQFLDETFSQASVGIRNDEINTAEMVCRFDDVVNIGGLFCKADGVCFVNVPGLVVGQLDALDVVRVICQFYLEYGGIFRLKAGFPFLFSECLSKLQNSSVH